MSKITSPLVLARPNPSPCYVGFWPGIQVATDGLPSITDVSGKGNHLVLGSDTTYAQFCITPGYLTITGAPSGANKAVATAGIFLCDLALGQCPFFHMRVKAAAPGATAYLINCRGGAGDVKGISVASDAAGKPVVFVRGSGGSTWSTTAPTQSICDGTDHDLTVAIDPVSRKVHILIDGVAVSNSGQTIDPTVTGSTQGDDPLRFGAIGDFAVFAGGTWVNGANLLIRYMHALVMPYWPANFAQVVAEVNKNPQRRISERLLPATASA